MRKLNYFDLLQPAFMQMKKVMLEPFNKDKWLFIIIVSLLSGTFIGYNPNVAQNAIKMLAQNGNIPSVDPSIILTIAITTLILIIAIGLALLRAGACARYMNIDAIMNNRIGFRELWNKYYIKSAKYFGFSLKIIFMALVMSIAMAVLGVLLGGMGAAGSSGNIGLGCLTAGILGILLLIGIIWLMIYQFIGSTCAVPAMLRMNESVSFDEAIKECTHKINERKKEAFGFFVANILLSMVIGGLLSTAAGIFTIMMLAAAIALESSPAIGISIVLIINLVYFLIMCVVNGPYAAFIVSYQLLSFSMLFPEYALLLPVRDESGKIIGTMSYEEHLENERKAYETQSGIEYGINGMDGNYQL